MNAAGPNLDDKTQSFLSYKQKKLEVIAGLESKRLEDLKDARTTVFKYALPAAIIDGAAGALATLLGTSVFVLFPIALFVIFIYYLAVALDRRKYRERVEIMDRTKKDLWEIMRQEIILLRRSG